MAKVKGVVEWKNKSQWGYGIKVDGSWYNSKYNIKAEKGDLVEFDDGGKNYCRELKVLQSGGGDDDTGGGGTRSAEATAVQKASQPPLHNGRSIIRQNSLTNANAFHATAGFQSKDPEARLEELIQTARVFESYSAGDEDVAKAAQVADELMGEDDAA